MGVHRSPGPAASRTAHHSIKFYFRTRLIVPVTCLAILWGLVTAAVLVGFRRRWHLLVSVGQAHPALAGAAVITGAAILVVLAAVALMVSFARQLSREIDGLAMAARYLADDALPRTLAALRDGRPADDMAITAPWPRWGPEPSVTPLAAAADAITRMHRSAVAAATAEASLRSGFRKILVSLGKRNQSLLHRQLRIIDALERQASSPAALAELFTLDHLTTRMRRHAESLTILSGIASGRSWVQPVPVIDVMRAAAAEVEDYTRVTVVSDSDEAVAAAAVTDIIHLLAELIENATLFSPSSTRVEVRAERVANGFAIEVEDRGLGIPADQLAALNAQLASPPDFDLADADRLGLFVAGRLAARHGVYVALTSSPYRGIKAVVVLPDAIVVRAPQGTAGGAVTGAAESGSARLDLHAPEVLALAGEGLAASARQADPAPQVGQAQRAGTAFQADAGTATATLAPGLPRRVRPGSHAEAEATGARAEAQPGRQDPVDTPAPEAARSLAASLQTSWQRSRQADEATDSGSTARQQLPARHDATAPNQTPSEDLWLQTPQTAPPPRVISPGCSTTCPAGWRTSAGRSSCRGTAC
jgi:signal transduction histidine kinase